MIGDGAVGCTALWIAFSKGYFYTDYVPTVVEYYKLKLDFAGELYNLIVYDTAGQEDYDRFRPIGYDLFAHSNDPRLASFQENLISVLQQDLYDYDQIKKTIKPNYRIDACIIVFAVDNPASYENVMCKWFPEVNYFCKNIPIILVGNKTDLRTDPSTLRKFFRRRQKPVTTEMGKQLARKINAVKYVECSCVDGTGVEYVFEQAVWASICRKPIKERGITTQFLNLVFIGNEYLITSLMRSFLIQERLNVLGYRLNMFTRSLHPVSMENVFRLPGDDYTAFVELDGEVYGLHISNEFSDLEANKKKKSSKQRDIDLFIVLFSVSDPDSFQDAAERWIPKIKFHYPKVPLVLVRNKDQLSVDENTTKLLSESRKPSVTTQMGKELAHTVNAASYLECSSSDGTEIEEMFEEAVWASLRYAEKKRRKKSKFLKFFTGKGFKK